MRGAINEGPRSPIAGYGGVRGAPGDVGERG